MRGVSTIRENTPQSSESWLKMMSSLLGGQMVLAVLQWMRARATVSSASAKSPSS